MSDVSTRPAPDSKEQAMSEEEAAMWEAGSWAAVRRDYERRWMAEADAEDEQP